MPKLPACSRDAPQPIDKMLPYDLLVNVCTHIESVAALSAMGLTSKAFRALVTNEPLCWAHVSMPSTALTAYLQSPHAVAARSLHVTLPT